MRSEPEPNVSVCRPLTPEPAPGFTDEQTPHLKRLVRQLMQDEELEEYLVWFYTPMALPLADELRPVIEVLGKFFYIGDQPGAGQTMKVINNLLSATAITITS